MRITAFDISIVPPFVFLGIFLPILFGVSFLLNLVVIWLMLKFSRNKTTLLQLLFPTFIYTLVVGMVEIVLLLFTFLIGISISSVWENILFIFILLYGTSSLLAIFFIFKLLMPHLIRFEKGKVSRYALIMAIVTNPAVGVFIIVTLFKVAFWT